MRAGFAPFVGALGVGFGGLTSLQISGKLVLLTYLLVRHSESSCCVPGSTSCARSDQGFAGSCSLCTCCCIRYLELGVRSGHDAAHQLVSQVLICVQVNLNNSDWENALAFTMFRVGGILCGVLCAALAQVGTVTCICVHLCACVRSHTRACACASACCSLCIPRAARVLPRKQLCNPAVPSPRCSDRVPVQIFVFPRSAATECLRLLAEALHSLVQLNAGQVWQAAEPQQSRHGEPCYCREVRD